MRTLLALTLYVSLAAAATGEENNDAGFMAVERKDFTGAAALFEENWKHSENVKEKAVLAANAGIALHQAGRDAEAKQWLERSWTTQKTPATAVELAIVYRFTGDYTNAESVLREGLAQPVRDNETQAVLLNTLADIFREEGRAHAARELFEKASGLAGLSWRSRFDAEVGLADLSHEPSRWQTPLQLARDHQARDLEAIALRGEGESWMSRNNAARAEPLFRQSLAISHEDEPLSHQEGTTLSCLAQLYLEEGKAAMAEDSLLHALAIDEKVLGESHPQVATLLQMLADASSRMSRTDESRRYLDRAEQIMTSRFGANSLVMAAVFANRASIEQRALNYSQAAGAYQKSLASMGSAGPDLQAFKVDVMERYAQVLKSIHRTQEARDLMHQVKTFRAAR